MKKEKERRPGKYERMLSWLRYLRTLQAAQAPEAARPEIEQPKRENRKMKVKKEWGVGWNDVYENRSVWRLSGNKTYATRAEARAAKRMLEESLPEFGGHALRYRVLCRCKCFYPISAPWWFAK